MWKDENFSKVVSRVLLVVETLAVPSNLVGGGISLMRRMPRPDFGTGVNGGTWIRYCTYKYFADDESPNRRMLCHGSIGLHKLRFEFLTRCAAMCSRAGCPG